MRKAGTEDRRPAQRDHRQHRGDEDAPQWNGCPTAPPFHGVADRALQAGRVELLLDQKVGHAEGGRLEVDLVVEVNRELEVGLAAIGEVAVEVRAVGGGALADDSGRGSDGGSLAGAVETDLGAGGLEVGIGLLEGLVGGVLSATALGAALWWITPCSWWQAGLIALTICLMGFVGGLVMSAFKRDRGLKDFGTLLPGHGGILDRVDSLVFAAPVFFHLTHFVFGFPGF